MQLSKLSLALTRRRQETDEDRVATLFDNNEQGAWYDPSAANVTWRRNLLTYTEQFDNAAWLKTNLTATANTTTAPDSTSTADKLIAAVGAGGSLQHFAYVNFPLLVAGTDYVFSVYLKAAEYTWAVVYVGGTAKGRYINLVTGDVGNSFIGAPTSTTVTDAGNGWWKVSMLVNMVTATSGDVRVYLAPSNGSTNSVGDDTSGLFAWGAQFERSSSATPYQRIVTPEITYLADVQSQPLLFTDAAGTTPVVGVESPVGLILDKSKGLMLGSELVTNGTFTTDTNWNKAAGWTISGGTANASAATGSLDQPMATTQGKYYVVTYTVSNYVSGQVRFQTDSLASAFVSANGTYKIYFLQTAAAQINCIIYASGFTGSIDNISVKLLDGNHASQTTTAARPVLRARYNLFTHSEQVATTWQNTNITVASNDAVAPDGTTTADLVSNNDTGTTSFYFFQQGPTIAQNTTYTMSIYAKKKTGSGWVYIIGNAVTDILAWFNLDTGTKGTTTGWDNTTIDPVPNMAGWYRITGTFTNTAATNAQNIGFFLTNANGVQNFNSTGLGNSQQVWFWGADLRFGTSAGDYQRIEAAPTATSSTAGPVTYALISTTTGRPFKPYLAFDGVDDVMIAPMDAANWINCTIASGLKFNFLGGTNQCPACVANSATSNSFAYIKDASNVLAWGMTIREDGAANGGAEVFANSNLLPHILYGASSPSAVSIECDNSVSTGGTTLPGPITANRIGLGALTRSSIGAYANHNMYGTIFVRRVLTAAERVSVRNYLADKTGVTL